MPLVDADRIRTWGATEGAVHELPELIARLIANSCGAKGRIEGFRTGRGTRMGDYDGFTDVDSMSPYLPSGPAVWELGTTDTPARKAQDDYDLRTDKPGRVDRSSTTFVVVASQRWQKDQWEADRNNEQQWKDVRSIDADTLFHWCSRTPPAHIWLSERAGDYVPGTVTPEEWWVEYSVSPPINPEALTTGRERESKALVDRVVAGGPAIIAVHAKDREEAAAFVIATLKQLDEESAEALLFRMTVVEERAAWRSTVRAAIGGPGMILLPLFDDRRTLKNALARNHVVIVPALLDEETEFDSIRLPPPDPGGLITALKPVAPHEADRGLVPAMAFGSVSDLRVDLDRRMLGEAPEWARPSSARTLIPAILAGEWDDSNAADRAAIERLSGRDYSEVMDSLVRWRLNPRPPVRKVGSRWLTVNRKDSWQWVYASAISDAYALFRQVSTDVLSEADPKFELPADEQWMAGGIGAVPKHSYSLRRGLADGLAMIAACNFATDGEITAQDISCMVVRDLLRNGDSLRWASLASLLPFLAEACPDEFLTALDGAIDRNSEAIRSLFADQGQPLSSANSPHVGLIHALEALGRSPEYLSRVAVTLALLSRLDPGGRLASRPLATLSSLFIVGFAQTGASRAVRQTVLDMLRQQYPDVAWSTMLGALPIPPRIVMPAAAPSWRSWPIGGERSDADEYGELVGKILADVDGRADRCLQLCELLEGLPAQYVPSLLDYLSSVDASAWTDDERDRVWQTLLDIAARHQQFSSAGWALPPPFVARIRDLVDRFQPTNLLKRVAYLFSPRLDLSDYPEPSASDETSVRAREQAIHLTYQEGGIDALVDLAQMVETPWRVGLAIASGLPENVTEVAEALLRAADPKSLEAVRGLLGKLGQTEPGDVQRLLTDPRTSGWSPEWRAIAWAGLAFSPTTWRQVEQDGAEVATAYWQQVPIHGNGLLEQSVAGEALERLRGVGNLGRAIAFAALYSTSISADAIIEVLADAARSEEGSTLPWNQMAQDIMILLEQVQSIDGAQDDVATLEWQLLPFVRASRFEPVALQQRMAREPRFFVDVLSLAFRARGEAPRSDLTPKDRVMAQRAFQLLSMWHTPPGVSADIVDGRGLRSWTEEARSEASAVGRRELADLQIGGVLAYTPMDADGVWPPTPVRDLIDQTRSEELDRGINIGVRNSRGVTTRGLGAGGQQERELAARYIGFAEAVRDRWPRTSAVLSTIAQGYEREGRREDAEAELEMRESASVQSNSIPEP